MGMEEEIIQHVFTSGEASLSYIKKNLIDKKFFHVGICHYELLPTNQHKITDNHQLLSKVPLYLNFSSSN